MPVYVEEMTSEVTAPGGDFPLNEAQLEILVSMVLKRLEQKQREARSARQTSGMRSSVLDSIQPDQRGGEWS